MNEHKIPKRKNIFEAFYGVISKFLSQFIVKTSITPNQITVLSGLVGIIGAYFLTTNHPQQLQMAGILIQLYCVFDAVDGDIARIKGMQSYFGKWLDVFFDKLNDFLIILGLSIGVYLKTNEIYTLYLGIILMGLVFFIQFSMVMNSIIYKECETNKKSGDKNPMQKRRKIINIIPLIDKVRQFIGKHLLLEHCTFLFIVSFFVVMDLTELGLWFLTIHALCTIFYITISGYYKIKHL